MSPGNARGSRLQPPLERQTDEYSQRQRDMARRFQGGMPLYMLPCRRLNRACARHRAP